MCVCGELVFPKFILTSVITVQLLTGSVVRCWREGGGRVIRTFPKPGTAPDL